MRYLLNAHITVFLKPEEYLKYEPLIENTKNTIKKLVPLDFETEKLSIIEESLESFENKKIKKFSLKIEKESHTNTFLKSLNEHLKPEQKQKILEQAESRLDEELCFFIRLDKFKLLHDEYWLTDSGDCFHIKMGIAAFPRKKEAALKVVEEIFK